MTDSDDTPPPADGPLPTILGGLNPGELLARGLHTVKMSSAGAHGWDPPALEEVARLFPSYELLGMLGRGGMGAVFKARQISLDRLVAIKLLPLEISVDQAFVDRFRREARAMAKLNHPHIITVYEFGQTAEGHLFFVMEFVDGANLADIIHGPGLAPDQALSISAQVCTALAYAHGKGVVHRDIKPANVMIDTESQVKVADFGLARLTDSTAPDLGHTMTGTVMGTPDYMAPEQKRGMNVDHRADIYSLGVMLYEMLCRETPQGAFDLPSQRAGCDPRLDAIVLKAMQQAPDRRYQSTHEMKTDVETARTPQPAAPGVAAPLPKPPKAVVPGGIRSPAAVKKPRTRLYAGTAAALVVGGIALFLTRPAGPKGGADVPPVKAAPATAPAAASDPVQTFAGHRYQFVPGAVTWSEAKAKAEALGGHLATLTTKEESEWAIATFRHQLSSGRGAGKAWIGALKNSEEEPWRWITGEPFGFADWFAKLNDPESVRPNAQGPFGGALNAAGRWSVSKTSQRTVAGFLLEWDTTEPAPSASTAPAAATKDAPLVNTPGMKPVPAPVTGWISLFDGKSLDGWKAGEKPGAFSVRDGKLVVRGSLAHLFYDGPVQQHDFKNFELKADIMTKKGSNSGLYFHTEFQQEGFPQKGFEVQVNNTQSDPKKTAGLYNIEDNFTAPAQDDEWFTMTIRVEGRHVITKVNEKVIIDWIEPDPAVPPALHKGRIIAHGTFAIQAHDPGSEVHYKNIFVRPLP